jgi:hypothetical protein
MNHDPDLSTETDNEVSAAYQAVADESAPPRLDQRVLRQAAAAASVKWFEKYSFSFLRPITFVATLGLSLAIVLQYSDTWLADAPGSLGPVAEETDLPPAAASAIAAAAEASAEHIDEQAQHGSAVLTQESLNKKPPLIAGAEVQRTETERFCEAAQSESADKWWDCVVQLELDGRDDAATIERELFIRTFPDYVRR